MHINVMGYLINGNSPVEQYVQVSNKADIRITDTLRGISADGRQIALKMGQ